MGVYDIIIVPCPKCGEEYHAQSKSGECTLRTYNLQHVPSDVLSDGNRRAPFTCDKCGTRFELRRGHSVNDVCVVSPQDDVDSSLSWRGSAWAELEVWLLEQDMKNDRENDFGVVLIKMQELEERGKQGLAGVCGFP